MGLLEYLKKLFGKKDKPEQQLTIRESHETTDLMLQRELLEARKREEELLKKIDELQRKIDHSHAEEFEAERQRLLEEIRRREGALKELEEEIEHLRNEIEDMQKRGSAVYFATFSGNLPIVPEYTKEELDLPFGPYTFENFIIGSANKFVYTAARAVAEMPADAYNPLFIWGGVGLGKTHLLKAIANYIKINHPEMKVVYTTSEAFSNELIDAVERAELDKFRDRYRKADVLIVDDIQFLAGEERTQEEFFHTFNTLYDAHKQIIISSDRPPVAIKHLEDRLRSRFEGGLITEIKMPDFETRKAILEMEIKKRNLQISEDVIEFLAGTIESNIRTLKGALNRVVVYAASNSIPITVDLCRELLQNVISSGERREKEKKKEPEKKMSGDEEKGILNELMKKYDDWRLQGYITLRLERALDEYKSSGDIDALREVFASYERDLEKLNALESRLKILEGEGFDDEIKAIRLKMLNPDRINEIEDDIKLLEEKIRGRKELLLHRKMEELMKKGEMARKELETLKNMERKYFGE